MEQYTYTTHKAIILAKHNTEKNITEVQNRNNLWPRQAVHFNLPSKNKSTDKEITISLLEHMLPLVNHLKVIRLTAHFGYSVSALNCSLALF